MNQINQSNYVKKPLDYCNYLDIPDFFHLQPSLTPAAVPPLQASTRVRVRISVEDRLPSMKWKSYGDAG